ncbi:hypothetical protein GGI04_001611 [Coemansia thaxteri]|uniref:Velvet domain-containing protein n=1 Tax=Coemansia thaxteri TaxID=2663907 RepID=A0A9W8BIK8_9FUNG|nr:hypothetical protein H4R26_002551 [Coemansia thaxteri]KAJ2007153.1 hypothetical protein GGI04_001611 [Coemansia thaxteri]KAJ2465030.1 hypothetical protein GGI02_004819 [Coemansia sp. RSA 2322]KAJ2484777.1 hypothetical protein EV174_002180 [Coemansia sp. RSA 2320]
MTGASPQVEYQLVLVQQPLRARVTSPGERDRRPVDPCPIIQLQVVRSDGVEDYTHVENALVMQATLYDETGTHKVAADGSPVIAASHQPTEARPTVRACDFPILGSPISSMHYVRDLSEQLGLFFCFPDIRVRASGQFRLLFSLFELPSTSPNNTRPAFTHINIMSGVFTVYTAKDFPGVGESTPLSKKLSGQGVSIPIRNKTRLKSNEEDSAGE